MEENAFSNFEDRAYLSPTLDRDERLAFIDTLRETQAQNTAKINADTYALGSQLPSNLGGLGGGEDTFIARYQTPQTEQTVADLRTAAQQSALNTALSNLQNAWKKRYNDAILNYQKRAAASNSTPEGDVEFEGTLASGTLVPSITGGYSGTSTVLMPDGRQGIYALDKNGNIGEFIGYADDASIYGKLTGDSAIQAATGLIPHSTSANTAARTNTTIQALGLAGRASGMGGRR